MLTVFLVRHGETSANAEQRVQGWGDLPLNATGQAQAAALADALAHTPLDAVYASDLIRARETAARIAAPHKLDVQSKDALREMHQGELEGRAFADVFREYPELMHTWMAAPARVVMPGEGGESLQHVQDRAWPALQALLTTHGGGGRIAVVTHALTLRCLLAKILGMPLDSCRNFHIDIASLTRLEVNGRMPGTTVRTLNAVDHLRGRPERGDPAC